MSRIISLRTSRSLRAAAIAAAIVVSTACGAAARGEPYRSDRDHPLRVVHTFVAPVGTVLDWAIFRPLSRVGDVIAPYEYIGSRGQSVCSKERPARSCTYVVK